MKTLTGNNNGRKVVIRKNDDSFRVSFIVNNGQVFEARSYSTEKRCNEKANKFLNKMAKVYITTDYGSQDLDCTVISKHENGKIEILDINTKPEQV